VLTALWLPAATAAREDAHGVQSAPELRAGVVERHAKLDSALARVADTRPGAQLVRVEAVARGGRRAELERAISAGGGSTSGRYGRLLEARIPARALEALAAHPATRRLRTPTRPHPQEVSSEGVVSTEAAAWHSAQTKGNGVEIAIVDVGFAGWQDRQAAGELPAQVVAVDFCSLFEFDGVGADDHGTAVAEIVHDVAPAAKLHLICIDDPTSLGEAKDYVVANDIPIVNHSIGWLNTSRGDGTGAAGSPDAIVADARAQGVLWVNAAGNYGELHWSGTFSDPDDDTYHNFTALDEGNDVFLYTDVLACVYLKWDDWPATDQDFDLLLFQSSDDPAVDDPVASSTFIQDGSLEPYEELCYQDPGGLAGDYYVAIKSEGATKTPRFDLIVTDGEALQHHTSAGGLVEPATSPHALAVGAVCFADGELRDYSSRGPTIDGRAKPDLAGPDGVSTVTYEAADTCDAGFAGTSAATPHVAAAAALVKQANPSFGPAELQAALESRTGPPEAKNNALGAGSLLLGGAPPFPPSAPANTALPAIVGLFNQGQTLTASDGEWSSGAALFLAYRWLRCNAGGAACDPIAGARSKTYVPTAADLDLVLKVRVTGSNGGGSAQALSAGTPQIQSSLQPPANVLAPSLAGSAQFGETMSASSGAWSGSAPLTITAEWLRCNSDGAACAVIAGADAASYQLALEDIGMTIRVRVTATNPAGAATASSSASATILPPPPGLVAPPAIAGAPVEGQTLTASPGTWTFASALVIQWRRCAAEGACADIPGATSATYAPNINDAGLRLQVAVTATNTGGTSSAASALTSPVARVVVHGVPPPNPRPGETVTPQTRLVVLGVTRSPRTPQAGRRFALVVRVGTRATSARGAGRRVSCSAKIGRKGLRPVAKSIRGGAARCVWAIPKSAAGKRLRTTIVVSEGARSVRKTVTTRIRGARLR
jgi:hypothetical protein